MIDEIMEHWGMIIGKGKRSSWRKIFPSAEQSPIDPIWVPWRGKLLTNSLHYITTL
jgi:hypothetical protein